VRHKSSAHAFAFTFQSLVQPASFHHSSLQLSVQFATPIFPSPYYFVRRFINRSRNNLVSPPSLAVMQSSSSPLRRFLVGPHWSRLGAAYRSSRSIFQH